MAFTESSLQAQLDTEGLCARITSFNVGSTYTDVFVQNINSVAHKSGWAQVANSSTAAQAATSIKTALG